ncbi:hypothetical protein E2C01_064915 [Portunus trituberculatus]|uniref:Uncharacterized protein n=1 Tax=Portunus trituberculatus TaxID=210409 RepID=A0A5B7HEB6_PORTR|nr:hypothetical protein [Portunus trituberculatus]
MARCTCTHSFTMTLHQTFTSYLPKASGRKEIFLLSYGKMTSNALYPKFSASWTGLTQQHCNRSIHLLCG